MKLNVFIRIFFFFFWRRLFRVNFRVELLYLSGIKYNFGSLVVMLSKLGVEVSVIGGKFF